jgi:hypothetical protein
MDASVRVRIMNSNSRKLVMAHPTNDEAAASLLNVSGEKQSRAPVVDRKSERFHRKTGSLLRDLLPVAISPPDDDPGWQIPAILL